MLYALVMTALTVAYRLVAATTLEIPNFSPIMALAFCGAIYLREKWLWAVPFVALALSDLWINHYYLAQYDYGWELKGLLLRYGCYGAALGFGWLVSRRKSWSALFGGALAASFVFYLFTNTAAWAVDEAYAQTLAGWWQAMTIGHPEYPPTIFFFKNSLISDLSFTALFAVVMEYAALRAGRRSLLVSPALHSPKADYAH